MFLLQLMFTPGQVVNIINLQIDWFLPKEADDLNAGKVASPAMRVTEEISDTYFRA